MKQSSDKVQESMREKFEIIISKSDAFAKQYLNEEYSKLIRAATAALCRKRASPLQRGSPDSWAAGIIHAIGSANFSFGKFHIPNCIDFGRPKPHPPRSGFPQLRCHELLPLSVCYSMDSQAQYLDSQTKTGKMPT